MGMNIKQNETILWTKNTDCDQFDCDLIVSWPPNIELELFGKNCHDTLMLSDGTIQADKYIKLEAMIIDKMPVHILSLLQILELDTGTEKIKSNYWGFNGKVKLAFDAPDSFSWHLRTLQHATDSSNKKVSAFTDHQDDAGQGTIY
jgi:hypothetical protein